MRNRLCGLTLAVCLLLPACSPAPQARTTLAPISFDLPAGQSLTVEMGAGSLELSPSPDESVHLSGNLFAGDPSALSTSSSASGLRVSVSDTPAGLSIQVPTGRAVFVTTDAAGVTLRDHHGALDVRTVSGAIQAGGLEGEITLISNRGGVSASDCRGQIHISGNYGLLSLVNVHGDVNAANIMGDIHFSGAIGAGNSLHLETDHSAVALLLAAGSSAEIEITTTSGLAACLLPGLEQAGRGCLGRVGDGAGTVQVRTVSGDISLKPQP